MKLGIKGKIYKYEELIEKGADGVWFYKTRKFDSQGSC
ncbi:hypothetical protein BH23BAC3_BH23BAC3_25100 [soil metagenome]